MTPSPRPSLRSASRAAALVALLGLVLGSLAVTAPAAQAAWFNAAAVHGGKVQVCKVHVRDSTWRLRMRLDNRRAPHTHIGGLSRVRNFKTVSSISVRARAGRVSGTKSMLWKRSWESDTQWISAGIGDTNGQGLGGAIGFRQIPRC